MKYRRYWFYKNSMWDSAAVHLTQALSNAGNLQEKARWEYLAAQLFEMGKNYQEAEKYYNKVISHTTDLVLEIYARLANIRADRDGDAKSIEKRAEELAKMAKREKYEEYRDIIYYMAAQMMLDAGNVDAAISMLKKSTQYPGNDPAQRNKAFLQLAELSFAKKLYRQSYNYYDSINIADPTLKDTALIGSRKRSLGIIATNAEVVYRQDSLQRIASLPEEERKDFVKQLVKRLRKEQGLKDDNNNPLTNPIALPNNNLFPSGNNPPKGEWYFYNTASKTRGLSEFRSKWGNRPKVDNWRRSAAIIGMTGQPAGMGNSGATTQSGNAQQGSAELSFDALYEKLPLSEEGLKKSNDSLQEALFLLGKAYIQEIEDCQAGTETLEKLRTRFTAFEPMDEVLFNLYYCYNKQGETAKAAAIKQQMSAKYASSNLTNIVTTGKNPLLTEKEVATKTYEDIYDLFIEGKFEEALLRKKAADEKYGNNYWTPQLLYIESVYYVKQKNDSAAIRTLNNIINQFSGNPLIPKARRLIDVLNRRTQIEDELQKMVVTRATDSTAGRTITPVAPKPIQPKTDSTVTKPPVAVITPPVTTPKDSAATKPPVKNTTAFTYNPNEAHYVVLVLNKVDPVFVNEAKNAYLRYNRDTYYNKTYSVDLFQLDTENRLLMIAPFATAADAVKYIDAAKPKTSTEILPWLKGGKYNYLIMTDGNFDLLKSNPELEVYRTFLNQYLPGKF
ncbi:MAG: hypothetical protein IPG86_14040 [Chitinophagaceae bacterium]|nr:hypothetical protein [Chitinophagaceae bacterium]